MATRRKSALSAGLLVGAGRDGKRGSSNLPSLPLSADPDHRPNRPRVEWDWSGSRRANPGIRAALSA